MRLMAKADNTSVGRVPSRYIGPLCPECSLRVHWEGQCAWHHGLPAGSQCGWAPMGGRVVTNGIRAVVLDLCNETDEDVSSISGGVCNTPQV